MGPFDPQDIELFTALDWIDETEERYRSRLERAGLDTLRAETELAAW
jgi:hypothetical protein